MVIMQKTTASEYDSTIYMVFSLKAPLIPPRGNQKADSLFIIKNIPIFDIQFSSGEQNK
jgi:hypothetical protein